MNIEESISIEKIEILNELIKEYNLSDIVGHIFRIPIYPKKNVKQNYSLIENKVSDLKYEEYYLAKTNAEDIYIWIRKDNPIIVS